MSNTRLKRRAENGILTCYYCGFRGRYGESTENNFPLLNLDHRIPKTRGGSGVKNNTVVACCNCNTVKGNRLPEEFAIVLRALKTGHMAREALEVLVKRIGHSNAEEWLENLKREDHEEL